MRSGSILVLDGWRGCAILALLTGHFLSPQMINTGRFGVELFFVLSGRLMAEVLFIQRTDLIDWARRRFARLVPALWFFLLVMSLLALAIPAWKIGFVEVMSAGGFYLNYAYGVAAPSRIHHLWSLCVEAHCYVVLGVIAWLGCGLSLQRIAVMLLALAGIAMAIGVIQSAMEGISYYAVYWRSDTRGASILVSAALFLLLRDVRSPWLFAVCAPLGIALQFNVVPDAVKYTLGTTALAAAVAGAPHAHLLFRYVLSCAPLRWFGLASYSMYLWQQPFALAQMPRTIALPGAILCGAVAFYVVEAPLRRMLTQRGEGKKAVTLALAGDLKQVGAA